nr:MAG TPA: hypothetical protein [Caudoviricetes sp.]
MNKMQEWLYNAITDFSTKYGCHKFNDDENHKTYMNLVDMCINAGLIPEANRNEFSTHGRLEASIIYADNRVRFCSDIKKEV